MATVGTPGAGRRTVGRRGNLRLQPFPALSGEAWREPGPALESLRGWAEDQASAAIDWYLRDMAGKRRGARALRALAILLLVAGAVVPLVSAAQDSDIAGWGYVLLAGAAGAVAFDRLFGLSSGWMRDLIAVQRLQRTLSEFQLDWEAVLARAALDPHRHEPDVSARLHLVRRLATDVAGLVADETAQWRNEFERGFASLHRQGPAPWLTPSPPDVATPTTRVATASLPA